MKMGRAIAFLFVLLISPAAYGQTSHTVGDNSGWDTTVNYVNWANGKTFTVGDSLVFNYGFSHAVDEVKQDDYTSCNTANAISSDSNSPTTIPLSAAGTRYFICPRSNHCGQGMKLAVTVVAASGTTPSPPSGGTTPSPPSGGATPSPPSGGATPSPPSDSSPPPPAGSAAAALGGGKSLMAGLSLVVMGAMLLG